MMMRHLFPVKGRRDVVSEFERSADEPCRPTTLSRASFFIANKMDLLACFMGLFYRQQIFCVRKRHFAEIIDQDEMAAKISCQKN